MESKEKLVQLGTLLGDTDRFGDLFRQAEQQNSWFTPDNLHFAFKTWSETLTSSKIQQWLHSYVIPKAKVSKKILIVMAGNIPLVGFHDLLCVLVAGHQAIVKLSSNDSVLLPYLVEQFKSFAPDWAAAVTFTDEKVTDYDAVIATGSNNTARYFEYYFGKKPHIIRKNRHSIAILTGDETSETLFALGKDIFQYYGLGCRSVAKLFVPQDYNFDKFFEAIYPYHAIINEQKYANNYDYNKAVYLMGLYKLLENGFLMLKEDEDYGSPIATLFYEYYSDVASLKHRLTTDADKVQCIVAHNFKEGEIAFGEAQIPQLWNYADEVDTLKFLLELA
nr:acyl-CoA reductase [uncultured Capnocytophaga sp.]